MLTRPAVDSVPRRGDRCDGMRDAGAVPGSIQWLGQAKAKEAGGCAGDGATQAMALGGKEG